MNLEMTVASNPDYQAKRSFAPALPTWVYRHIWLADKMAQAKAQELNPMDPAWREFELASEMRTAVERLRETGNARFSTLLLLRAQALALLRCHLSRNHLPATEDFMTLEDWTSARTIPAVENACADLLVEQVSALEKCLLSRTGSLIGGLDAQRRTQLARSLETFDTRLFRPLAHEARKVRKVVFARWMRTVSVSTLCAMVSWMLAGRLLDRSGPVNLASNAVVMTSSQSAGVGVDHRLLVDGDRRNIGFHTEMGPNQFVVVDLGSVKRFDKVVVYNRADCCQERAVPLRLEVSSDGIDYTKLRDRSDVFDVWSAEWLRAKGRYVRLRLLDVNYLHLAEVEVY